MSPVLAKDSMPVDECAFRCAQHSLALLRLHTLSLHVSLSLSISLSLSLSSLSLRICIRRKRTHVCIDWFVYVHNFI